jgi:hypothetical protein
MGERNSAIIHTRRDHPPIYVYCHWLGADVSVAVQDALSRGASRWDDPSYLSRIIIEELIDNASYGGSAGGCGIGTGTTPDDHDGYYNMVHVWIPEKHVVIGDHHFSFENYIHVPTDELRSVTFVAKEYEL